MQVSKLPPRTIDHKFADAHRTRELAVQIEKSFVAEMLKLAGVGQKHATFGGGVGEDQFASFLRDAHASEIVRAGGMGLTSVFQRQLDEFKP